MGAPLSFGGVIDSISGQIDVLVTNGELIDWLRARGRFLVAGNNGLGRTYIAPRAYGSGAVKNRGGVPHIGANASSPMTSAEYRIVWSNFIRLLAIL
jgi:hypothetical protein